MRYPKDQKERTRRFVVETASHVIRRDGIEGAKIVPLMREAGMTQGAFYKNFGSREELVLEAILYAALEVRRFALQWAADGRAAGVSPIGRIIDEYLSERHLTSAESGCPFAALGSELWRQPDSMRRAIYGAFSETAELIGHELPPQHRALCRSLYMFLASTLQAGRLAVTRAEMRSILEEGRHTARTLVGLGADV